MRGVFEKLIINKRVHSFILILRVGDTLVVTMYNRSKKQTEALKVRLIVVFDCCIV